MSLNPQNQAKTFHYALLFGRILGAGGGLFDSLSSVQLLKEMQSHTVGQAE